MGMESVSHSNAGSRPADSELRSRLTPEQYHVTQEAGTERAFSGQYWDCHDDGMYHCVVCDAPLFSSAAKYDSGTGWPSFFEAAERNGVKRTVDRSHGMVRVEARCANCDAHLGHVFDDGPTPSGERFCMNSASLRLEKADGDGSETGEAEPFQLG
jgi:peptide-methionine (R)-S-oxide reductase